jgi:hypothetical protein
VTPPLAILSDQPVSHRQRASESADLYRDFFEIGDWLADNVPEDTVLATNAAGIVPYRSGLPTIDMLGLNDMHIAHRELPLGVRVIGHEKYDADYVLSRQPDLIIIGLPELTPTMPASPEQVRRLVQKRTASLPGDLDLIGDPRFPRLYTPITVKVGSHGWLTMFARRARLSELRPR